MTLLTQKAQRFEWGQDQKRAFEEMKEAFTTVPVLARFDFERDAGVETDASAYISAGVLSQYDDQGILHPVAFSRKKHACQGPEARKVAEGGGSRLSGPTGARGGEGSGSR